MFTPIIIPRSIGEVLSDALPSHNDRSKNLNSKPTKSPCSDIDEMLAFNLGPEVERLYMSYKTSPRTMMTSTKRENVAMT